MQIKQQEALSAGVPVGQPQPLVDCLSSKDAQDTVSEISAGGPLSKHFVWNLIRLFLKEVHKHADQNEAEIIGAAVAL